MLKRFQKLKRVLIMKQMLREMKNKDKKERLPVWRSLFGCYISISARIFKNIVIAKYLYSS